MEEEVKTPVETGEKQEIIRDEKGRFVPGVSGNPLGQGCGRPRKGLKEFDRERFANMSMEEKLAFLDKISPELRYRMAEGNPATSISGDIDNPIVIQILPSESIEKYGIKNANEQSNNISSSPEDNSQGQS